MSMHQGLDLSRFKKVSSDKKTTTLRHAKGHEIRVAHSGLTPKMREHLERLPMAEGGEVEKLDEGEGAEPTPEDTAAMEGQEPAPADTGNPEGAPEPGAGVADVSGAAPQASAPTPRPPKPDVIPDSPGNVVDVIGQRRPPVIPTVQDLNQQDALFAADLAAGHIKPETYQSLFAKKDTLGKIGTLFGLLIGGAGAGLTHQPNAILEMMNKEIDRDLDAQKASQANAHNWFNARMRHDLQAAQIPMMNAQTAQAMAGMVENLTNADLQRTKMKMVGGMDTTLSDHARNAMMIAIGHTLQDHVNKLAPNSPERQNAQLTLDQKINPAITAQVNQNNQKIVAKKTLAAATKPAAAAGDTGKASKQEPTDAINYGLFNSMKQDALNRQALGLPPTNGLTPQDIEGIQKEAGAIKGNRYAAKRYNEIFWALKEHALKGALSKEIYNSYVGSFGPEMAKQTVGRFVTAEAQAQAANMFPTLQDILTGADKNKYDATMNDFMAQEANTPTLDAHPKLKTPFPTFPSPFKDKKKDTKVVNGVEYERGPNGEAIPVSKSKTAKSK